MEETSNSFSRDEPYTIQEVPLGTRRQIRVVCIGAGYSGLLLSVIVSRKLQDQNVDFQVYEMNGDLGGTWLVNRFPGCQCDSPAHIYSYSFCPNPHWSNVYAKAPEIHAYLKSVSEKYNCEKFITYNRRVTSAIWQEQSSQWHLRVANTTTGVESEDTCHILVNASGVLNNWKWPQIEGIGNFQGKMMHSAAWDESYDFTGKKVAIIGIGSSGIQILPEISKIARHTTLFARSSTWIVPQSKPESPDTDREDGFIDTDFNYLLQAQEDFVADPKYLQRHRRDLADRRIESFKRIGGGRSPQENLDKTCSDNMRLRLGESDKGKLIAKNLIPSFPVGCRRITPGPRYLEALMGDNVESVWDGIRCITEKGIQTNSSSPSPSDDEHREFDAIICATGFDCSYAPRFTLRGRNGVDLANSWKTAAPEAYFGTTVAGCPNYFMFVGPNSPVTNGGLVQAIQAQGVYIYKCISKMQQQGIRSMEVKRDAMDDYNTHSQAYLRNSVWSAPCNSWYKRGNPEGRVVAVYAGSAYHFVEMMRNPRWEDYMFDYHAAVGGEAVLGRGRTNRFAFLGNGFTSCEAAGRTVGTTQTLTFEEYWNLMEIPAIYE